MYVVSNRDNNKKSVGFKMKVDSKFNTKITFFSTSGFGVVWSDILYWI